MYVGLFTLFIYDTILMRRSLMKNLKKVLFVVVFILIAFVGGMFFANKQTEPEITSTLIQNRIEQASNLVTTKFFKSEWLVHSFDKQILHTNI